ncbi:hypothetical protein LWF01_02940 [Saxibacter everestensis]|uniref:Head decoration protein n=1 Tax=Saxibacter everestensis TaxID=2909229 RepID=A0ABY8QWJ7_9MICO|nr:hypothetical protein LWF01_02940 [Brevibacteriaceae bacterium ZFBP1038]
MTNLSISSETFGGAHDAWLGSRRGVSTARTVTLDATGFAGATDGVVKGGTPVAKSGEKYVAYTAAAGQTLAGFVLNPTNVSRGDAVAPLIDHGRIITSRLPVAFAVPANPGAFIFV